MINTQNVAPGIPCPITTCGHNIKVTIQDLLFQKVIKCPHCLVELTMNREESKDTISAMADLNHALENAETTKNFSGKPTY
ncbi:hypothetical protein ACRN9C_20040 [Shewanella frigidimarina]|uniref:hypothetical protein n=1 Tax=Shewanella frigidimarina TaxID=56812 RepID=UPI003D7B781F